MTRSGSRHYYRSFARAAEGVGEPKAVMQAYGTFIQFGAGSKTCGGCHEEEGPRTMAWYKDWWAGRKYAEWAKRAGVSATEMVSLEGELSRRPENTTAQMKLAYLLAASGQRARADQLWATTIAPPRRQVRADEQ